MKALLPICALGFLGSACVSTGQVRELSAVPPLAQYKTAKVHVRAFDPGAKNAHLKVKTCQAEIPAKLVEKKAFDSILNASGPDKADLIINAVIVDTKESVRFGGSMVSEDKAVNLEINLIDGTTSSTVAQLAVSGNSKSNVRAGIGGVDIANFSDLFRKACGRVGEHLGNYLKKQRKAGGS